MKKHSSNLISYDNSATNRAYNRLNYDFDNAEIRDFCLKSINKAVNRHFSDIGLDLNKPWEEIETDSFFQIEYLFVGKINPGSLRSYLPDEEIGINITEELNFGKKESD